MQLLLIRHGETEWSSSHRQTGLTDVGLTQVGFEQATRTAALISHLSDELGPPATIYSSPLSRAAKTASSIGMTFRADAEPAIAMAAPPTSIRATYRIILLPLAWTRFFERGFIGRGR